MKKWALTLAVNGLVDVVEWVNYSKRIIIVKMADLCDFFVNFRW